MKEEIREGGPDDAAIKNIENIFHKEALSYLESLQSKNGPDQEKIKLENELDLGRRSNDASPVVGQKRLRRVA